MRIIVGQHTGSTVKVGQKGVESEALKFDRLLCPPKRERLLRIVTGSRYVRE